MANPRFNKQTTNRRGAMGGGMMKRGMYKKGSFPDMSGDGKVTQKDILIAKGVIKTTFAKPKKPKIGGQEKSKKIKEAVGIKKKVEKLEKKGGKIPPQLKKFVMAKKKKAKMKKDK